MDNKQCSKCKEIRLIKRFSKHANTKDGLKSWCNYCVHELNKMWRKENPEKYRKQVRISMYKKYDMTLEDYEQLYNEQNGLCRICKQHFLFLDVDHCHKTGKTRSLLCRSCNVGIGFFKDKPNILLEAAEYLQKYKKKSKKQEIDYVI